MYEEKPRFIRTSQTNSTNSHLREILKEEKLPEGSVVISEFQTAGRGQPGNSWESEQGKNLLFSTLLYPECIEARDQFLISQITALSVKSTLDEYADDISIKWPNDIYWKDKKICGMLIENDLTGSHIYCSIIGIGINLNQETFHSDAPNPVSLKQITGKQYDKEEILTKFLLHFYSYYLTLLQEEVEKIRSDYHEALYRRQGYHWFEDEEGKFEAYICHIEPTGHLLLERKDGTTKRYAFKEVSYIYHELLN